MLIANGLVDDSRRLKFFFATF